MLPLNLQKEKILVVVFSPTVYAVSVFLRFYFSMKKYTRFRFRFNKFISVLSRLLRIDKNLVQKLRVCTTRAIFQSRAVPL